MAVVILNLATPLLFTRYPGVDLPCLAKGGANLEMRPQYLRYEMFKTIPYSCLWTVSWDVIRHKPWNLFEAPKFISASGALASEKHWGQASHITGRKSLIGSKGSSRLILTQQST